MPGYAATILRVVFFAALNCLGLGIIGGYVWRAYENVKGRPGAIVAMSSRSAPEQAPAPRVPEGIDA